MTRLPFRRLCRVQGHHAELQRRSIITFQDNSFYSVSFRDLEFKILGITGAEKVLDAVKDFVENGEVWV
ncbi:MAG: hypothetical protein MJY43_03120 [Bacteroidales bacterium]|nr:hypothetical protein [Bacteroidales bacterium]